MGHDAKAWRRLRREFVEAAAKFDEFETFIERNETSEDWYCNNGRYSTIGRIRWPYGSYRKCWILAPFSGENEEPFSVMKTLFAKAWLWLPRDIANDAVDTAEMHLSDPLSPSEDRALWWAKSDYQYWCWLIWFHLVRQLRVEHPTEAAKPSQKLVLSPFRCSADLITQWGLDGNDGKIPEWLAPPTPDSERKPPSNQHEDSTRTTKDPKKAKRSTVRGEGREKLIGALTKHHKYADGSCMNEAAVGNNQLAKLARVSVSTASEFFNKQFDGHKKYIGLCSDLTRLIAALKLLNQEFQPHILFGDNPPEEAVNPDFKGDRRRKPRASESGRDSD